MDVQLKRASQIVLLPGLALLVHGPAFAQSTPDFPDPRTRVEIRYDDPARQTNARSVRIRDSQCRENIANLETQADLRQRMIDLAAREWEAFHFPILDIANENLPLIPSVQTKNSGARGHAIVPGNQNTIIAGAARSRMLRNGLMEDEASVAARIGGYWAVIPNASAVAVQNNIWGKGGWPGAGWAQPWSAAFISWVMCEAGLTKTQFLRAPSHANYLTGFFQNTGGSAYTPKPLTETPAIGDLLCAARDKEISVPHLQDAEQAARNDTPMHCDLIVGLLPDRILLIGGNVQNAVTMTIAPRARNGAALATPQRPWFGIMKLNAPPDAAAKLARTPWQCLGKKNKIESCLQNL